MTGTPRPNFILVTVATCVLALAGCHDKQADDDARQMTNGGDAHHGVQLIRYYGCASCHQIPGIRGADALVGPTLDRIASRNYVGGRLPNTPRNMITWIQNPKQVDDKAGMP